MPSLGPQCASSCQLKASSEREHDRRFGRQRLEFCSGRGRRVPKKALTCDLVFLDWHVGFRAGKFIRRDMARGGESRKRSVLGNAHSYDEIIRARRLGLL